MDGGIQISKGVSGIAMGLISEGNRAAILTDILGMKMRLVIWTSRSQVHGMVLLDVKWISRSMD
jgi:hypothetical protein